MTKAELIDALWPDTAVDESNLTQTVFMLRKALRETPGAADYVVSVPRVGYKFTAEVTVEETPAQPTEPATETSSGKSHTWGIAASILVFVLAGTGAWTYRQLAPLTSPATKDANVQFQEHDWVLLGGFENQTGDPLFDGTLRAALETELNNSGFVSVVSPERVEDSLKLMQQPADTWLDRAVSREVSMRDGEVRAFVIGRIQKLGTSYSLSVEVVDPVQNRLIASDMESAEGQDQILPAVRRLSNRVRQTLGESMEQIDRSNQRLQKVTTRSLRALQLYTEADAATKGGLRPKITAQLLRQALTEDPDFASAHIQLAFALRNEIPSDPGWREEAERALALSSNVSERERYFILGSYNLMLGNNDQAATTFETLIRLYPDDYFSYVNLAQAYAGLGRPAESARMYASLADLRPNDYETNATVVMNLIRLEYLDQASYYAERALAVAPDPIPDAEAFTTFLMLRFQKFHELWRDADARGALAELERLEQEGRPGMDNSFILPSRYIASLSRGYAALGRLHKARSLAETLEDGPVPLRMWTLFGADDDFDHLRAQVTFDPKRLNLLNIFIMMQVWPDRTHEALASLKEPPSHPAFLGEIAFHEGRFQDAVQLLQAAFERERQNVPSSFGQIYAQDLATALEQLGEQDKALEVLEQVSALHMRNGVDFPFYGVYWLKNQARLSAYYHRLGRDTEARAVDDQLRKVLAVADADHPILQQLNSN